MSFKLRCRIGTPVNPVACNSIRRIGSRPGNGPANLVRIIVSVGKGTVCRQYCRDGHRCIGGLQVNVHNACICSCCQAVEACSVCAADRQSTCKIACPAYKRVATGDIRCCHRCIAVIAGVYFLADAFICTCYDYIGQCITVNGLAKNYSLFLIGSGEFIQPYRIV